MEEEHLCSNNLSQWFRAMEDMFIEFMETINEKFPRDSPVRDERSTISKSLASLRRNHREEQFTQTNFNSGLTTPMLDRIF